MHAERQAAILAGAGFAAFSLTDALVKWLTQGLPVAQVGFMVTGMALVVSLAATRGLPRPRQPLLALLRGGLLAADTLMIFYAFSALDLAEAYALAFTAPLLVALMATAFLGEKLGVNGWAGMALGFLGVLVVLQPQAQTLSYGHIAALGSALAFALSIVALRRVKAQESDGAMLVVLLAVIALVSAALTGGTFRPVSAAQGVVAALAGTLMAIGHWLLIRAGRLGAASRVAPLQYSQLIWAALWGAVFFASPLGPALMAGTGLIIFSGWLVLRPTTERPFNA